MNISELVVVAECFDSSPKGLQGTTDCLQSTEIYCLPSIVIPVFQSRDSNRQDSTVVSTSNVEEPNAKYRKPLTNFTQKKYSNN